MVSSILFEGAERDTCLDIKHQARRASMVSSPSHQAFLNSNFNSPSSDNDQEAETVSIGFRSGLAASRLSVQGRNQKSSVEISTSQLLVSRYHQCVPQQRIAYSVLLILLIGRYYLLRSTRRGSGHTSESFGQGYFVDAKARCRRRKDQRISSSRRKCSCCFQNTSRLTILLARTGTKYAHGSATGAIALSLQTFWSW